MALPQTLRIRFADGSHRDMPVTSTGSWQRFVLTTPSKAVSAQLDPDNMVLTDTSKLNDSKTVEPNRSAAQRWFATATSFLQALFALIAFV